MKCEIFINNYSSISALGKISLVSKNQHSVANFEDYEFFYQKQINIPIAKIKDEFLRLYNIPKTYLNSDRIIHLALLLAEDFKNVILNQGEKLGVFIGSSRAATGLFETTYQTFKSGDRLIASTSPLTTHASVASAIASFLSENSVGIEHSVTCSSGLFSIIDAFSWLQNKYIDHAIAGGIEAPLTDYTLAQMLALKIYTKAETYPYSMPFVKNPKFNSFVLGEGAALFNLGLSKSEQNRYGLKVKGFGMAFENSGSLVAMTESGVALEKSMREALSGFGQVPDLIIAHAPGTILGDAAEACAINNIFGESLPLIISTKFLFAHCLGASGALSLAFACDLLQGGELKDLPYETIWDVQITNKPIESILINATGFGGTAVSLLVTKELH